MKTPSSDYCNNLINYLIFFPGSNDGSRNEAASIDPNPRRVRNTTGNYSVILATEAVTVTNGDGVDGACCYVMGDGVVMGGDGK